MKDEMKVPRPGTYRVTFGIVNSMQMMSFDHIPIPIPGDLVSIDGKDFTVVRRQFSLIRKSELATIFVIIRAAASTG